MCLDKLLQGGECLIYSFGLSPDWTFEEMLDSTGFGCKIYAYDHTIKGVPSRRGQQIHYFKTGIGFGPNLKPLSQIIEENNHKNSTIEYLKIDIEGTEFTDG